MLYIYILPSSDHSHIFMYISISCFALCSYHAKEHYLWDNYRNQKGLFSMVMAYFTQLWCECCCRYSAGYKQHSSLPYHMHCCTTPNLILFLLHTKTHWQISLPDLFTFSNFSSIHFCLVIIFYFQLVFTCQPHV